MIKYLKMKNNPFVSIIIVNFNGYKYLKECLDSLYNNTYQNFEIIVVDNNSSDESCNFIHKNYPKVKLIEEKSNHGFAGGNNIGYKNSTGDVIILLNNDTKVEKDFIKNFIQVFDEFPNCAAAQSKIVLYDDHTKLDSAGSFWSPITILYHFGLFRNSNDNKFNKPYKVFSAKGASLIIKKEVIEKVGLFVDEFWHYYEETDFCHRIINAGYDIYYYPKALCFHKIGVSRILLNNEQRILFSNTKNKIFSFILNFKFPSLIWVLTKHLAVLNFLVLVYLSRLQIKEAITVYKAIFWNIINIRKILKLRNKNIYKGTESILPSKKFNPLFYFYPDKY